MSRLTQHIAYISHSSQCETIQRILKAQKLASVQ